MADADRSIADGNYNPDEGKVIASINWLITRIYENKGIPDKLQNPFYRLDDGSLHLTPTILTVLTNGSLYVQAASKIFHDNSLLTQFHGSIIRTLSSVDVEVREHDGTLVTESKLISTEPFIISSHLAMIDGLMTAHVKSIVSIERVVQAVSEYTSVDKREEPLDFLDALLFWINKICLLVRDDVERHDVPLKGSDNGEATIPEMEDLYEDLCDGTCICALVAFYRPNELNLQEVSFSDPISIQDCRYNLGLLKDALSHLPWNPFHFEIDDILYLHESLQPNVNAFLADLFQFFEPLPVQSPPVQVTSPVQRRFVPIEGIPDLRANNIAARPQHPPKMRNMVGLSQRDRTMSMASADSHLTSMSGDSLRFNNSRPTTLPANVNIMNFKLLQQNANGNDDHHDIHAIPESSNMASVRLALQERKREYERKKVLESSMNEEERQKAGKDAFFKLMSKNMENNHNQHGHSAEPSKSDVPTYSISREAQLSAQVQNLQEQINQMTLNKYSGMSHAISQPAIHHESPMSGRGGEETGYGTLPNYSDTPNNVMSRNTVENPLSGRRSMFSLPYATLQSPNQAPSKGYPYENAHYALPHTNTPPRLPSAFQVPQHMTPMSNVPQQQQYIQYAPNNPMLPPHLVNQTAYTAVSQSGYAPVPYFPSNTGMSMSMYEPRQQPYFAQMQQNMVPQSVGVAPNFVEDPSSIPNANTFHLHQPNASSSRLDPPLELNRNLTNWGITYQGENRPLRKTWMVPQPQQVQNEPNKVASTNVANVPVLNAGSQSLTQSQISNPEDPSKPELKPEISQKQGHQQSPPKDPEFRSSIRENRRQKSEGLSDLSSATASELTPEMQAKRDALYANLMRRKEQVKEAAAEEEAKLAAKRLEEQRKQEIAEQRKLEKEMRRQQVLENYKRKKLEQELCESFSGSSTARSNTPSSGLSRGHSQPPFGRPKSQSNLNEINNTRTLQRHNRSQTGLKNDENQPRIFVPSTAEPSLKLYAKKSSKSNRTLIHNAISYSVFPGAVTSEQRIKVQEALAQSDSKHFLILFRDQKCQYRGLYTWDTISDTAHKIHGAGPKVIKEDMLNLMFKYDVGGKKFQVIPGMKSISLTTDAFTIDDSFWQKPIIPHSGAR